MDFSKLLSSLSIFQGFTPDELTEIQNVSDKQDLEPNVDLITEGETAEDFFVLLNGKAHVLKSEKNEQGSQEYKLATLSAGDVCGEIAFIDHLPRSSTVRTVEPTTVLRISSASILKTPHGKEILHKLTHNIGKTSIKRLRDFNDQYLYSLQETFNLLKQRQMFGMFFIVVLAAFSLVTITEYVIRLLDLPLRSHLSTTIRILIIFSPCFYWIWKYKIPLKNFGISTVNWQISLLEGIGLGLALTTIGLSIDAFYNETTFQHDILEFLDNFSLGWWILTYSFLSYLQEFIARGFFQSSVQRFIHDERGYYAVFITAVVFGGMHIHRGWQFALLAFMAGYIMGIFYLHRQNLLGVTAAHIIMGLIYLPVSSQYAEQ